MENLEKILEYYKNMKNAGWSIRGGSLGGNKIKAKEELFAYIIRLYGYDKLPRVMSTSECLFSDSHIYYHGFKSYDHGAELLIEKIFHIGHGYTPGTYFTLNKDEAAMYTEGFSEVDRTSKDDLRVLKILVDSKKSINYSDLCIYFSAVSNRDYNEIKDAKHFNEFMEIVEFSEKIRDPHLNYEFLNVITCPSILGVMLGYDYLIDINHIIVLNRGVIGVSKNERDRFVLSSRKYRNKILENYNGESQNC